MVPPKHTWIGHAMVSPFDSPFISFLLDMLANLYKPS